jgi:hypothetical protein
VPTLIAQTWFQPEFKPLAHEPEALEVKAAAAGRNRDGGGAGSDGRRHFHGDAHGFDLGLTLAH